MSSGGALVVVVGPTASGKTELAVRLAEGVGAEIVSADSVQIYRRFELGTGKPSKEQTQRAPHHLIDCADPLEAFDAARWAECARAAISEIRARGRMAIVCGGTFLWVRALVHGLAKAPPADPAIRERHRKWCEARGRADLHAELARCDPPTAARLAPNDFVRVSRALEVFESTGIPLSRWQAEHGFRERLYDARLLGIARPPAELAQRIEQRVTAMLANGWVEEVRALLGAGLDSARAMNSVGYRQIASALRADSAPDPRALADEIRRATRLFARRQRTWLRDQDVLWLTPEEAERATVAHILDRSKPLDAASGPGPFSIGAEPERCIK